MIFYNENVMLICIENYGLGTLIIKAGSLNIHAKIKMTTLLFVKLQYILKISENFPGLYLKQTLFKEQTDLEVLFDVHI